MASTKAFLAQITATYVLGLYLAQLRGNMFADEVEAILDDLRAMPEKVQTVIDGKETVTSLAKSMQDATSVLFLGRHVEFPVALEGALSSKKLLTCTPKVSQRASSSMGLSRWSRKASRSLSSCLLLAGGFVARQGCLQHPRVPPRLSPSSLPKKAMKLWKFMPTTSSASRKHQR